MRYELSHNDPEHLKRLAAERQRIEQELPQAERDEAERAKAERKAKRQARAFRGYSIK